MSKLPSKSFLVPFCGLMLAINAFSCDILLPAIFAIQAEFNAPIASVQAVVPLFLMAAAGGQVIFGPASDRYGRKPVLIAGLLFYLSGCLLALVAPSLDVLYVARLLQGFGASCIVVLARAILRDTHSGPELGKAMAMAMAIFSIGPLCAPLCGVALMSVGGWRGTFIGVSLAGAGLLAATLYRYRETNVAPDPTALQPARLLDATSCVLSHPQSRYFLMVMILTQFTIILLVSSASRFFKTAFGMEGLSFAMLFALAASGIALGQLVNNRFLGRMSVLEVTRQAVGLLLATVVLTALLARTALMGPYVLTVLLFLFNLSFLVVVANSVTLILEPHKNIAGTASALLGCITQMSGSVLALMILPWLDGTLQMWSLVQLFAVFLIALAVTLYVPTPEVAIKVPKA